MGPGTGRDLPAAVLAALLLLGASACAHRGIPPEAAVPGATERGLASWYGRPYHGRRTASGEVYDMYRMTAAHRTLPFGTRVRVTRRDDGRSVEVRINDRGPFVRGRIIDLSYAAARKIGLDIDGVAPVTLEVLAPGEAGRSEAVPSAPPAEAPAPPEASGAAPPAKPAPQDCFWVQVGAFGDHGNAVRARERLEDAGERAVILEGPSGLERVRLGPFGSREAAEAARARVLENWPAASLVPCG